MSWMASEVPSEPLDNGLLSRTSALPGLSWPGSPRSQLLRDSRTLSGASPPRSLWGDRAPATWKRNRAAVVSLAELMRPEEAVAGPRRRAAQGEQRRHQGAAPRPRRATAVPPRHPVAGEDPVADAVRDRRRPTSMTRRFPSWFPTVLAVLRRVAHRGEDVESVEREQRPDDHDDRDGYHAGDD